MTRTLGTCSLCGGRVSVPTAWMSVNPPVPCCESCGARPKQPHGAVIDMEPRKFSDPNQWQLMVDAWGKQQQTRACGSE